MRIQAPLDIGLIIRDRRRRLGLNQSDLAAKAGVGRQWLIAVEQGKPRAEIGMILRTLNALGLALSVAERVASASTDGPPPIDIDAVVAAHRTGGR